jgi:hypothetical protein
MGVIESRKLDRLLERRGQKKLTDPSAVCAPQVCVCALSSCTASWAKQSVCTTSVCTTRFSSATGPSKVCAAYVYALMIWGPCFRHRHGTGPSKVQVLYVRTDYWGPCSLFYKLDIPPPHSGTTGPSKVCAQETNGCNLLKQNVQRG